MGISPDVWGPSTWTFLHLIVLSEPDSMEPSRTMFYKQLYEVLQELLPCQKCRNHLRENLKKLPPLENIQTKRELFDWTVDLHNKVNEITGKRMYTREEAYQHWKAISENKKTLQGMSCTSPYWKYTAISIGVVFLLYIGFTSFGGQGKEERRRK